MEEERVHTVKLENANPGEVFARLDGIFGNVFSKSNKSDAQFFGVIVGEKYPLSSAPFSTGIVIIVSGHEDSTIIDIMSAGGKRGLIVHWDKLTREYFTRSVKNALAGKVESKRVLDQIPLVYGVDVKKLQTRLEEKKRKTRKTKNKS